MPQILRSYHRIRVSDGRTFAWHEVGSNDPAARKILFCTGAGMSGSLVFGESLLEKMNLRILSPDRPGLGGSSFHAQKTLQSWQTDVREWLQTQDLMRLPTVGFSQGSVFALALASADLSSSLALVSGQDDFSDPEVFDQLDLKTRSFVQAIRGANPVFLADFESKIDPDGFWNLVMSMSSEVDKRVYLENEFAKAYRKAVEEGFTQGSLGYLQDLRLSLNPWPFKVESVLVPTQLWYGDQDTSPIHSPDFGKTLAARLPFGSRILIPNAGGSVLWTHAREILTTL